MKSAQLFVAASMLTSASVFAQPAPLGTPMVAAQIRFYVPLDGIELARDKSE